MGASHQEGKRKRHDVVSRTGGFWSLVVGACFFVTVFACSPSPISGPVGRHPVLATFALDLGSTSGSSASLFVVALFVAPRSVGLARSLVSRAIPSTTGPLDELHRFTCDSLSSGGHGFSTRQRSGLFFMPRPGDDSFLSINVEAVCFSFRLSPSHRLIISRPLMADAHGPSLVQRHDVHAFSSSIDLNLLSLAF